MTVVQLVLLVLLDHVEASGSSVDAVVDVLIDLVDLSGQESL